MPAPGPSAHAFESLEYTPAPSDDEGPAPPAPSRPQRPAASVLSMFIHVPSHRTLYRWLHTVAVAVLTSAVGFLISLTTSNLEGLRLLLTLAKDPDFVTQLTIKCVFNASLVALGAVVVLYIGPRAAGSGVPEVKAFLNGVHIPNALARRTLVAKAIGSALAVSAGLAVGKEGPLIHTGACLANAVWRRTKGLSQRARRDLVTVGAACGVAAAFQAPLGGVMFAMEEACTHWRSQLTWRTFAATAVTAVAVELLAVACSGSDGASACGYFNGGALVLFEVPRLELPSRFFGQVWAILPLAALGGLMGAFFTTRNIKLNGFRARAFGSHRTRPLRIAEAVLVSIATTVCAHCLPFVLGKLACVKGDPPGSERFKRFVAEVPLCGPGEYSDLAALLINPQDEAIRTLLTAEPGQITGLSLAAFAVYFYLLNCLTFGVALPSGLFTPSVLIGGALGRAYGSVLRSAVPAVLLPGGVDPTLYAILGAAAYMGGLMRMTVSICVILLEITGSLHPLPLVMLTLSIAKAVGDRFCMSVYDEHIKLKGFPFLDHRLPRNADGTQNVMRVSDAMVRDVLTVPARCAPDALAAALARGAQHSAFPVVDDDGTLVGLARRKDLSRVLDRWRVVPDDHASPGRPLHLRAVTRHAVSVSATRPLSEAHAMFRHLSIRVLPVTSTDGRGKVIGVLTRRDFIAWSGTWLAERAALDLDRDEAEEENAAPPPAAEDEAGSADATVLRNVLADEHAAETAPITPLLVPTPRLVREQNPLLGAAPPEATAVDVPEGAAPTIAHGEPPPPPSPTRWPRTPTGGERDGRSTSV